MKESIKKKLDHGDLGQHFINYVRRPHGPIDHQVSKLAASSL